MNIDAAALPHSGAGPARAGLDSLPLHAQAVVTGLLPASDALEQGVLLRLLEIGFLPGEAVRVLARGGVGADPIAVRVGQSTFALRRREASMVQVRLQGPQDLAAQPPQTSGREA
ncbi:ferrous iron transport protein A [Verminephrobacter aporrectodeae subsp. tuberculatae]|uniref:Ferrous iron transport protein A n=1 Tax=Verminephrobacter aporrectodeae subsp. tuberculatae TaxID=1110392 RepID=A0ABT3KWM7_9BURK|nr:FeoA family protein [Verminephrobacter aporrectodeae]MCW5223258.1 ferrous iron transport protein A [Verminephrobacter aporrectodeae subsp. tuberculatae]MCW5288722.1 ferrous iron transport protein A [Verminephrobacter aporrectodeae subsp. tuberculatae]MCW5322309.1 ferrous iron transport protein A [Verminephrobacter aporrectodeae subsp. tuberculatae]MCW8166141.1 ferrous iron transport protein A [Verminephrobacter aporrectodeae subsp. tuberculatae]MCW8170428.1 ferrous iron transport protein A 